MTEKDWLEADTVEPLLSELRQRAPVRQLRLWGCAVARRLAWRHLIDDAFVRAVETAERFAEGAATEAELLAARSAAADLVAGVSLLQTVVDAGWAASRLAALLARPDEEYNPASAFILGRTAHAPWAASPPGSMHWEHRGDPALRAEALAVQLAALYEVFGSNPFRPVPLPADVLAWHDGLARSMAADVLARRDWEQMPVLADALEDAGCEAAGLLGHLRDPGPHHLGCWALETILDRPRWRPDR